MTAVDPTIDWARTGPQLPAPLSISPWSAPAIETIRPHLTRAAWKASAAVSGDWDAPYFAAMQPVQVDGFCDRLAADPWQRDPDTGTPRHLTLQVAGMTVGDIGWHWEHYPAGWRRVGIVLYRPTDWGHGLGTRFIGAWTQWLLSLPDTYRIDLAAWSGDDRMLAVAHGAGLIDEALLRRARIVRGLRYDSVILGGLEAD